MFQHFSEKINIFLAFVPPTDRRRRASAAKPEPRGATGRAPAVAQRAPNAAVVVVRGRRHRGHDHGGGRLWAAARAHRRDITWVCVAPVGGDGAGRQVEGKRERGRLGFGGGIQGLLLVATNLKQWNMQQLPTFRDIYRISRSAAAPWTTNRPAQRAGRRSTTEYHLTRKEDFF
jgi:hypothetical protein